jgi:hypothetical protein
MTTHVKNCTVGKTREARLGDGLEPESQPQRLNEEHPKGMVVQSDLHRDMQRSPEMSDPTVRAVRSRTVSNKMWDPDLNGLTPEIAIVMHRYAIALVSRAVAPPRNPSVPCSYTEIFPGSNGEPGISARLVVDFWPRKQLAA